MQTFLPYPDFLLSFKSLDKKRAFKQVVEAKQLICCLSSKYEPNKALPESFKLSKNYLSHSGVNHPAAKMWTNKIDWLINYYNVGLFHCKVNLEINTNMEEVEYCVINIEKSWFIGRTEFHASHRNRLREKDLIHYGREFIYEKDLDIIYPNQYLWPIWNNEGFYEIIAPNYRAMININS